ncbi:hypothetical protein [Streptomyces atrovirens]|uniref:Uncharacterized protein n=1 Tax=Streptomyces atrovirens TaxID=285556 RepID=A0ABW0DRA3_9ACTN
MSESIDGWIWSRNPRSFLEVLSLFAGYEFDATDWRTIEAGVQDTDDDNPGLWYVHSLAGVNATLEVNLARAVGGEETSVRVVGAEAPELRLRTDTLLSAFAAGRPHPERSAGSNVRCLFTGEVRQARSSSV